MVEALSIKLEPPAGMIKDQYIPQLIIAATEKALNKKIPVRNPEGTLTRRKTKQKNIKVQGSPWLVYQFTKLAELMRKAIQGMEKRTEEDSYEQSAHLEHYEYGNETD